MLDRERLQAMILDHAYGLLEADEVRELETFLASPEGESLRQQAEDWKARLRVAARAEFPEVTFAAPTKTTKSPGAKPTPRLHPAPQGKNGKVTPAVRSRLGWTIAASLLIVGLGFGIPMGRFALREREIDRQINAQETAFVSARDTHKDYVTDVQTRATRVALELKQSTEAYNELLKQQDIAIEQARKTIDDKQFIVRLTGPERAQPGAPNEWSVETIRRNGTKSNPQKIEMTVRDKAGTVLFQEEKKAETKEAFLVPPKLSLPISFWEKVKPETELYLDVAAYDENNTRSKLCEKIQLARPIYATQLVTDKPMYKPGETLFFRSLTLDRATFLPPDHDMKLKFVLTKPNSDKLVIDHGIARLTNNLNQPDHNIIGPDKKPIRGIGCGEFRFPGQNDDDRANFPGGEYTLAVVEMVRKFDETQHQWLETESVLANRKLILNEYKPEIFEKKLEFDGKSYGPGDVVMVRAEASRPQGKLKGAMVFVAATVDGTKIPIPNAKTDDQGVVRIKFTVPQNVTKGEGSLTINFVDGGESEAIVRNIPLIGRELKMDFYPEGGDLVEGVPCRVYFQAKTPAGKPADIQGVLTDGTEDVTEVTTIKDADLPGVNRGQGLFTFTPKAGKKYFVRLKTPVGILAPSVTLPVVPSTVAGAVGLANITGSGVLTSITTTGFELRPAKVDGVVLTALDAVSRAGDPMRFRLETAKGTKTVLVGAYARGRLLDHQRAVLQAGKAVEVQLNPATLVGGVTRVTVFEEKAEGEGRADLLPVAERLVYRKPGEQLLLNVNPDKNRYFPGSSVGLDINALNEQEKPVPAILMVAVVNQSVIRMADEKTARLLPTHFLLASEVQKPEDLEFADFLLTDDPKQTAKAVAALDRLLGTQGWRRFAEQHPNSPRPDAEVDRLLVANGQKTLTPMETLRQELQRVQDEYRGKSEVALSRLEEADNADAKLKADAAGIVTRNQLLQAETTSTESAYRSLLADREEVKAGYQRSIAKVLPIIGGILLLIVGYFGILAVRRRGREALPYYTASAGVFGVGACAVLAVVLITQGTEDPRKTAARESFQLPPEVALLSAVSANAADGMNGMPKDAFPAAGIEAQKEFGGPQKVLFDKMDGKGAGVGGGMGFPLRGTVPGVAMPPGGAPFPPMAPRLGQPMAGDKRQPNGDFARGKKMAGEQLRELDQLAKQAAGRRENKAIDNGFRGIRDQMAFRYNGLNNVQNRQLQKSKQADRDDRAKDDFERAAMTPLEQLAPFFVREFAHHVDSSKGTVRSDFSETVYWHPVLVLPETGHADIRFDLSDDIARYQVLVAGHTLDGRIGAVTTTIEARKPFSVDPKTPVEVTASDRIDMPIRAFNDSDERRAITFTVTPTGLKPVDESRMKNGLMQDWLELAPMTGGRKIVSFRAEKSGEVMIRVVGTSDPMAAQDEIERRFRVVGEGFPAGGSLSDLLEGGQSAPGSIVLPQDIVKGSLTVSLNVYPTSLSDMVSGLEGLLREPGGCFEQTSTSNYPNLLILDYLKTSNQAKPEVARRARELLDKGYGKLVAFECPDSPTKARQGFEWFGGTDQQHEALTAYGLLQFKDLAKVYDKVDAEMVKRTQKYLLSRRDGKGGFLRNQRALDSFGRAPENITAAYIVWALTASDPDDKEEMDLSKELSALKMQAKQMIDAKKADTYFLALVANSLLQRPTGGNRELAVLYLEYIRDNHQKDGFVDGASTSITMSGGRDLQIETTALTLLAYLKANDKTKFALPITKATKWISLQRDNGGAFGSTQSTVLALKALITEANSRKTMPEAGKFTLKVGDRKFTKEFTAKDSEILTLEIPDAENVFKAGPNDVQVEITGKNQYPFALQWSCKTLTPVSGEKCPLLLETKLGRATAVEGESVPLTITVKNKLDQDHGMAVAIVGIPGGMMIPKDLKQIKELQESGKIGFYEIKGRELILYWRAMKKLETIEVNLDLVCEMPGEYRGPASRSYLYYNADPKHWVAPLKIEISSAGE